MKNLLFIFLSIFIISSCSSMYPNYDVSKRVQSLEIGMTKDKSLDIMGNHYTVESTTQEDDGILEILKYSYTDNQSYLLHFFNNRLVAFNKWYPPYIPQQNININDTRDNKN